MQNSTSDTVDPSIWTGRAQEILNAMRTRLDGNISLLTAGRVLEILHDKSGWVVAEEQEILRGILTSYPGYMVTSAESGLYHHVFVRQLELVCDAARNAYAYKLIS